MAALYFNGGNYMCARMLIWEMPDSGLERDSKSVMNVGHDNHLRSRNLQLQTFMPGPHF